MAKVQFGSGVAAISGRTAGTVFSRNKGGAYMRRFSVPTNPATQKQDAARNKLSNASSGWRNLTQAQRAAWNAWALTNPIIDRLGAAVVMSGHQAYVKINCNAQIVGLGIAFLNPPAAPVFKPGILAQEANFDQSGNVLELETVEDFAIGDKIAFYASPPVSPGVTNTASQERLIAVATLTAALGGGDPWPVTINDYAAVFGSTAGAVGKKVNFRAYFYSQGQFGQAAQAVAIIV